VLHIVLTAPPRLSICVLLTHLFFRMSVMADFFRNLFIPAGTGTPARYLDVQQKDRQYRLLANIGTVSDILKGRPNSSSTEHACL